MSVTESKPKSLRESIDEAADLLLQKVKGNVTPEVSTLLAEHIKGFGAVVDWYKVRGGAAADEKPQESTFERLKREFKGTDGAPGRRRRASAKSPKAPSLSSLLDADDAEPDASNGAGTELH